MSKLGVFFDLLTNLDTINEISRLLNPIKHRHRQANHHHY